MEVLFDDAAAHAVVQVENSEVRDVRDDQGIATPVTSDTATVLTVDNQNFLGVAGVVPDASCGEGAVGA